MEELRGWRDFEIEFGEDIQAFGQQAREIIVIGRSGDALAFDALPPEFGGLCPRLLPIAVLEGEVEPESKECGQFVFALGSPFVCFGQQAARRMPQDDGRFHFISMLATRPRPAPRS